MAKRVIVKGEDEPNMNDVWRVVWKDKDFKIFDKKFKDEDDARSFYYSIEFYYLLKIACVAYRFQAHHLAFYFQKFLLPYINIIP